MVLLERAPDRYPTITAPDEVGRLLRAIDGYTGAYPVRMALAFAPYVAVRPRNLRLARWEQIDWEKRLWIIPAEEMKGKEEHLVPLTDSSLKILEEVRRYSGGGELIFPSTRSPGRPMSDVTLARALARMGYGGEKMVPHGFRSMFSTVAHEESGFSHEAIEYQLAHRVGSRVSHAYNRALYLEERRQLMQWWSDWLDRVKLNGTDE
jgi:integrase